MNGFHSIVPLNDFSRVYFILIHSDTLPRFPSTAIQQIEHFDVFVDAMLIVRFLSFLSYTKYIYIYMSFMLVYTFIFYTFAVCPVPSHENALKAIQYDRNVYKKKKKSCNFHCDMERVREIVRVRESERETEIKRDYYV